MRSAAGTAILLLSLLLLSSPAGAAVADSDVLAQATQNLEAGKHYHVTTYLVRFLKENPGTPHRRELLQLIVKAYARSERKKKAAQALTELVTEFPEAAASLDAELLQLANEERVSLPSPPPFVNPFETPDRKEEVVAAPSPAAPLQEKKAEEPPAPPADTAEKAAREQNGTAPAAEPAATIPPVQPAPAPAEPGDRTAASSAPQAPEPEKTASSAAPGPAPSAAVETPPAEMKAEAPRSAAEPLPQPIPSRDDATATPQASVPPASTPPEPPAVAPPPSPAATPEKPAPATVLPEPALRKPAPAAQGGKPAERGAGFTLTFADITRRDKLDELLKALRSAGLQPRIREMETISTRYRVVSDCFPDRKSAEKIVAQLKPIANGPYIMRQGESFCAAAASFAVEENAAIEQKRLEEKGLRLNVLKAEVPFMVWQVSAGSFSRAKEAEKALKSLSARGIGATLSPLK